MVRSTNLYGFPGVQESTIMEQRPWACVQIGYVEHENPEKYKFDYSLSPLEVY
jgi:hypothetical protein